MYMHSGEGPSSATSACCGLQYGTISPHADIHWISAPRSVRVKHPKTQLQRDFSVRAWYICMLSGRCAWEGPRNDGEHLRPCILRHPPMGPAGVLSGASQGCSHPAAPPPGPPRSPRMVDIHVLCRWGPARGLAPAHVDPEPACQPAGALNTSSCACLRGDQVEAGLERWQHAFGRWAPATIHLSAPVYAVHAVAAAGKPVWVRPLAASPP